jgi:hypothetical protein
VRYVEDNAQNGVHSLGHGHHHHHHKREDTSDKAKLDHKKSDDEVKDTDQADKQTLHDGAIDKIDDADHKESNATIRKVYLILLIQNYEAIHYVLLRLQLFYYCMSILYLIYLSEAPRTLYSKCAL